MNPAEIVKKVLGEHGLTTISKGRWECECLAEGEYAPGKHREHVASEIVAALGLREVSTVEHWCMPSCENGCNVGRSSYWRTESVDIERQPLTEAERAEVDEWFARFAKTREAAITPEAHVTGARAGFGDEGGEE